MNQMFHYINQTQRSWAGIYGKVLESPPLDNTALYINVLNDNLLIPLSDKSEYEFKSGAGDELSKKMKALYSSSAFCVNVFEYWKKKYENCFIFQTLLPYDQNIASVNANNSIQPLIQTLSNILGLTIPQIINISYEKQFIIFQTAGEHPHLDINFECSGDVDIAFECKYREPFYNIDQGKMSSDWDTFAQYLKPPLNHWEGLNNLYSFVKDSEDSKDSKTRFQYLDAVQLTRHVLGLNKKHVSEKNKYSLVYLYCPSYFEDNVTYVDEIKRFHDVLKSDGVQFFPVTFYDLLTGLFKKILEINDVNDINYINYLIKRYL